MPSLIVLTLIGFLAQLVDGSLGMAYGVTSSTLLVTIGLSPVTASASVHLAELGTTLASGASHWRFGNVDKRLVLRLGVPGAIGGFVGANILVGLSTEAAKPVMAVILGSLGVLLLARFTTGRVKPASATPLRARFIVPLGLVAGVIDATGGGGWGPVATPSLLVSGKVEPRRVVGTVDTSEFLVAAGASVGFLLALGSEVLSMHVVTGLLVGGLIAAPLAAWLVRSIDPRLLGTSVGGVLLLTNLRTLLKAADVSGTPYGIALLGSLAVWIAALAWVLHDRRRQAHETLDATAAHGPDDDDTIDERPLVDA